MPVNVGFIGLGGLGTVHCQRIAQYPNARVAALCDVRPQRMTSDPSGTQINIDVGQAQNIDLASVPKYEDYRKLLKRKDVDAVVISTPTHLHAKIAIAALKAGKHVFCEKPMAINARQASAMIAAARASGKTLQIGHCLRFWPEYQAVREMVRTQQYGPVRSALFRRGGAFPGWAWENWYYREEMSGGGILDLHIHDVDVVNWLFGLPAKISSVGVYDEGKGVANVVTQFLYGDSRMIVAQGGWTTGNLPFGMTFTVEFERATVVFTWDAKPSLKVYTAAGTVETPALPADADAYREETRYFIDCIESGKPNELVPIEQTAQAVALVEAERKSIRTGKPVAIRIR